MKIAQSNGVLQVKSSSLWISAVCGAAAVLLFWAGTAERRYGTLIVGVLFLVFALVWLRSSTWIFDAAHGIVRWKRLRYFRFSRGEIWFSEITGVTMQNTTGERAGVVTYRVALSTSNGEIPLSDAYSGGRQSARRREMQLNSFYARIHSGSLLPKICGTSSDLQSQASFA